jgi:CelD/BcsL family acetyltransferase involved in cellulose biosynthesis
MATQLLTDLAPAAQTARFTHEIVSVDSMDGFSALRGVWRTLVDHAENASLCDGYEYCELAASIAFEQHRIVNVVLIRDALGLVVLWPFVIEQRGLLRIARRLTCGAREEYGLPLIRRDAGDDVWPSIMVALRRVAADVLEVHWVTDGTKLQAALDAAPQPNFSRLMPRHKRGHPGYAIDMLGFPNFDEFERTAISSQTRQALRRRRRQLEKNGCVESGCCETAEETMQILKWIIEQKRAWADARGIKSEYLADERLIHFYARLVKELDLSKTPLVAFTKVGGVTVAASLNMVGAKTMEGQINTYDPAFSEYSVGSLHLYDLIKWAYLHGLDYDFRPVRVEHKERWATRHTWHETRMIYLTARGRLLELALLREYADRATRKLARETLRRIRPGAKP